MTKREKAELVLILLAGCGAFSIAALLPAQLSIGNLLLMMSALLLLQSLIRDVSILIDTRRVEQSSAIKTMRCMCLESTIGMTGIVVGAGILGLGIDPQVVMGQWEWALAAVLTLGTGFAIKDFILQTNPWRIVREKNHLNIVFSWKK
jgi:hypothetical protein